MTHRDTRPEFVDSAVAPVNRQLSTGVFQPSTASVRAAPAAAPPLLPSTVNRQPSTKMKRRPFRAAF